MDWTTIKDTVLNFLEAQALPATAKIVIALLILVGGIWVSRRLANRLKAAMERARVDATVIGFLRNAAYYGMMTLVFVAILGYLGVETASIAAAIAAVGLAIGFALQGALGNLAAGVLLIFLRPFSVGDFVEIAGTKGTIEKIQLFYTIIRSGDNVEIIIPNGQVTSSNITNFTRKPTRRIDLVIGIGYDDDIDLARTVLEEILSGEDRVLDDPEPVIKVAELGDSSVNFYVRPWVKTEDYWDARWDLTEKIKKTFDQRGLNFPYPSRDLYLASVPDNLVTTN